jgi:phosphotriesterase-related protein
MLYVDDDEGENGEGFYCFTLAAVTEKRYLEKYISNRREEADVPKSIFRSLSWSLPFFAVGIDFFSPSLRNHVNEVTGGYTPGMVNTVLGPISPDQMGQTLVHEHFVFAHPGWYADETLAPYNREAALQTNLEVIKIAKAVGIDTIIDATTNDVGGRDPELYKELAKKTDFNIICSTGLFTEHEGAPAYFKMRMNFGKDISKMISELFIKEITSGIGKTGVRAGVIKVGTGGKITLYEEAVLKSAVVAQKATGVPIITHTDGPTGGVEQAEIFIREGADLKKVMIGHVSNSKDIEYHKAILAKGGSIAFDRLGLLCNQDAFNVKNIAELCKQGYAHKIMLSHDTCNFWLGRPFLADAPAQVVQLLSEWKIDHVSKDITPALKEQGVTDEQIKAMMVDNPKNLFQGK